MKSITERKIENMKSMMRSIFAYGELTKDHYNLYAYRKGLSPEDFNKTFDEHSKYLNDTFVVKANTYTDHEGCTYNSLIEK